MEISREEVQYIRRLMWALPKWDAQEQEFAEKLEHEL